MNINFRYIINLIFNTYIPATVVQSAGTFLTMALLTRVLSAHEFGRWTLLEPIVIVCSQVFLAGANHGLIKVIAQDEVGASDAVRGFLYAIRWVLAIGIFAGAGIAYVGFSDDFWALAVTIWLLGEVFFLLLLAAMRGANNPTAYSQGVIVRTGLNIILVALSWNIGQSGVSAEMVALWWAVSSLCGSAMIIFAMRKSIDLQSSRNKKLTPEQTRSGLRYGAPILLAAVLAGIVGNGDRYVLSVFSDAATVGQYVVYAKVASSLNLLVTPISLWWPTARFIHLKDADGGQSFFSRASLQIFTFLVAAAGAIWLISPYLVSILAPNLQPSKFVIGSLLVAAIATGMTTPLGVGLLKEGNTKWIPIGLLVASVIQLTSAFGLVRIWSIDGVAVATAVAAIVSTIFQWWLSKRLHPLNFPYLRLLIIALWAIAIICLVNLIFAYPAYSVSAYFLGIIPVLYIIRSDLWPIVK